MHLPPEVWYDVLGWTLRMQRATGASLACRMFHALCQAQEARVTTLAPLEFRPYQCRKRGLGATNAVSIRAQLRKIQKNPYASLVVPIAEVQPPKNIVDFRKIKIYHFDPQVFNFLRLIKHIFTELKLYIIMKMEPNLPALDFVMSILLKNSAQPDATFSLVIDCAFDPTSNIVGLFERFPEAFEGKIHLLVYIKNAMDENPGEEADAELDVLVEWLCASPPLKNGKPRALGLLRSIAPSRDQLIDRIKERFLDATQPVNFLVRFEHFHEETLANLRENEFTLENAETQERLVLRQWNKNNWILRRCPIGWNEQDDPSENELLELHDRPSTQDNKSMWLKSKDNQSIYFCLAHNDNSPFENMLNTLNSSIQNIQHFIDGYEEAYPGLADLEDGVEEAYGGLAEFDDGIDYAEPLDSLLDDMTNHPSPNNYHQQHLANLEGDDPDQPGPSNWHYQQQLQQQPDEGHDQQQDDDETGPSEPPKRARLSDQ